MKHHLTTFQQSLFTVCLVIAGVLLVSHHGLGQQNTDPADAGKKTGGQIMFTGDQLEYDQPNKQVTYTGNVKVVQGDTSMFSDKLVIHLDPGTGRRVEQAVATGNVRLVNADMTATGEEGVFFNAEQRLELTNNAKIWQGNNTISAHRIVAYLQDEIIEGYRDDTNERSVMTVYSKGKVVTPFGESPEPETASTSEGTSTEDVIPIVIMSDDLILNNTEGLGIFTGSVTATQNTAEIYADTMNVSIAKDENGENDVKQIDVEGNVRIVQETTTITGQTGVYLPQKQYAEVEGSSKKKARVEDKAQNLTLDAPLIKIFMDTNKIVADKPKLIFDEEAIPEAISTPTSEKKTEVNRENFPSVTLFPGRKK